MNQFTSKRYKGFETWEKVIFWIGILSFLNLFYWLVRLIIYLVVQKQPLAKRVNHYATQTYVFGWISIVGFIIGVIIAFSILVVAAFLFPYAIVHS